MTFKIGHITGLQFEIQWQKSEWDDAAKATDAAILARIDDVLVWGQATADGKIQPVEWLFVDVLEFLTRYWDWLRLEESYPIPLAPAPDEPSSLWTKAESRWENLGPEEAIEEEEAILAFEERHDLSHAFPGARLPSLWLLRQGQEMLIDSAESGPVSQPIDEAMQTLEQLGNVVVRRLQKVHTRRAQDLVARWQNRHQDQKTQLQIHTGANDERMEILTQYIDDAESTAPLEPGALSAAARQLGATVSNEEFETLLAAIAELPAGDIPALNRLSEEMEDDEHWQGYRAFEEGYRLANALRSKLLDQAVIPDRRSRLDPHLLLNRWSVAIAEFPIEDPRIDAIAVWGPDHGPAIFLNPNGHHAQDHRGRRSTLAHEICHLLIDRSKALPFAEVLNRALSQNLEARANAFAAELLLPRDIAGGRALRALEDGRPPKHMVDNLCKSYGVSREVTAWQIRHSNAYSKLPHSWKVALQKMVSNPERF